MTTTTSVVAGRILDTDSHEFVPAKLWASEFGELTAPLAQFFLDNHDPNSLNSFSADVDVDDAPISADMWQAAAHAPGAFDMHRRVDVMDAVGVDQAFLFPSAVGILGMLAMGSTKEAVEHGLGVKFDDIVPGLEPTTEVLRAMGQGLVDLHNNWCVKTAKVNTRLRPVGLVHTSDLRQAISEVERLASEGVRAICIPHGNTPAGISPGHPDADPLWRAFAESGVPLLFHGGLDWNLLAESSAWRDYGKVNPLGAKAKSPELNLDPYSMAQLAIGVQNYLTAMIYGGAFERVPDLHVGCIEVSSHWIGPMAENIDVVGKQFRRLTKDLSLAPSQYLERNVRVAPFWWEPVDKQIERFGLEDVYVYGSDYPHFEGGRDPAQGFATALERLGPAIQEKFFVTNAQLLMT